MAKKAPTSERIVLKGARLSFCKNLWVSSYFNAEPGPKEEKKFRSAFLLDPSKAEHAALIKTIKSEAKRILTEAFGAELPKLSRKEVCFGNGNDLDKIYDGYKDMFFIKASNEVRPLVANRRGELVVEGEPGAPYAGAVVNGKITLWVQNSHGRKAINANLLTVQMVQDGDSFGRPALDPEKEFEALEDAPAGAAGGDDTSMFDD